ncbi:porin [Paraburkholderia sp. J63]|uniref:porin n=1 Tax=Paraburkholderia sp. J63 TaxID=2805434 RepID=UPI002ABD43EA|nr:porin [Paraburkholderia sp. J63]
MKRVVTATIFGFLCITANAQSSVTLYGRVDNGIQYQSGLPNGHRFGTESGYAEASLFGLIGDEDLGGGTRAIFQLEAAVNTFTGGSLGTLFGHVAVVGLSNERFGTIRLGDLGTQEVQWDSFYVDPQLFLNYSLATLVRGRNWSTAGNSLKYSSPNFGGLSFAAEYDLTNNTSWNSGNPGSGPGTYGQGQGRSDGIRVQYSGAHIEAMVIYNEVRGTSGKFDNVYTASRSILAGSLFSFDPVKIYAGYQHLSAPDASAQGYFGTNAVPALPAGVSLPTAVDHEWIGIAWQVNAEAALRAACYHANANRGNGNATLYTVSGSYNLSKRTYLYAEVGYVHNSSTSNIGLNDGAGDPYGPNVNNDPVVGSANISPNYGGGQIGTFAGIVTHF